MLTDFFRLNGQFEVFDEEALARHLTVSRDLRSVLYEPDDWLPNPKRFKAYSFSNVSLSKIRFKEVTFTECTFEDCLFIGSTFQRAEFHRCKFVNCNFYKVAFEDCYIDPAAITLDRGYRRSHANIGVHLYQQLYDDASKSRQSEFAMKADIEFRKWKRWQLAYDEKHGKIGRLEHTIRSVSSITYELITGFGYKPARFVVATLVLFLTVSIINMALLTDKLLIHGRAVSEISFADSVFYTFSMMTVLGFSTIVPQTGFAKLLAVAQALLGVGWLGVFTSLLVKRFIK